MSLRWLYKLADELRANRNTCGRANSISKRIRVDVETFESAKKNLRMQKYPETFGRGLSHRVDTSLYLSSSLVSVVSKAMIFYSHSLFLVCSHVKGDFLVDKKYCPKLEISLIWKLCKPSTSTRAWISVLNRPFALWCHFTTPTTILQGFSSFFKLRL